MRQRAVLHRAGAEDHIGLDPAADTQRNTGDEVVTVRADRLALPCCAAARTTMPAERPWESNALNAAFTSRFHFRSAETSNELNSSMTSTIHGNSRDA